MNFTKPKARIWVDGEVKHSNIDFCKSECVFVINTDIPSILIRVHSGSVHIGKRQFEDQGMG